MAAGVASCGAEEKPREAEGEDCNYWLENPLAWPGISRDAFGDFYCHAGRCVCVCVCVCVARPVNLLRVACLITLTNPRHSTSSGRISSCLHCAYHAYALCTPSDRTNDWQKIKSLCIVYDAILWPLKRAKSPQLTPISKRIVTMASWFTCDSKCEQSPQTKDSKQTTTMLPVIASNYVARFSLFIWPTRLPNWIRNYTEKP